MGVPLVHHQLNTILKSYETKHTHLIFDKRERCFYTIGQGSVRSLNKEEYEAGAPLVHVRVNNFIKANQPNLNNQQLKLLTKKLTTRIQIIETMTAGLLNLLFYLFNSDSKNKLLAEKQRMETLKQIIEEALRNPVIEKEEEFEPEVNIKPEVKIGTPQKSPFKKNPATPAPQFTPNKLDRSVSKQSPNGQAATYPQQTPIQQQIPDALSTPATPQKEAPPPPPPPMTPFKNSFYFTKEPKELDFPMLLYKHLPEGEILKQVQQIDSYANAMDPILNPIEDYTLKPDSLKGKLSVVTNEMKELESKLAHYQSMFEYLQGCEAENQSAFITYKYKNGNEYNFIPFYTDQDYDARIAKIQETNKKRIEEKERLTNEIQAKKQKIGDLQKLIKDEEENQNRELQIKFSKIQLQKEEASLDKLEQSLKNIKPPFNEDLLKPAFKLSNAKIKYEEIIEELNENLTKTRHKQEKIEAKLAHFEQSLYLGLNFADLKLTLSRKKKSVEDWRRNSVSRTQWINSKNMANEAVQKPGQIQKENNNPVILQPEVINDHPDLQYLFDMDHTIELQIKNRNTCDNMEGGIYYQLQVPSMQA